MPCQSIQVTILDSDECINSDACVDTDFTFEMWKSCMFITVKGNFVMAIMHYAHECEIEDLPYCSPNIIGWNDKMMITSGYHAHKIRGECPTTIVDIIRQPKATAIRCMLASYRKRNPRSVTFNPTELVSLLRTEDDNLIINFNRLRCRYPTANYAPLDIDALLNS